MNLREPHNGSVTKGEPGFKAEKGRYHCMCHWLALGHYRALIFRQIKQLQDYIDVTVVDR